MFQIGQELAHVLYFREWYLVDKELVSGIAVLSVVSFQFVLRKDKWVNLVSFDLQELLRADFVWNCLDEDFDADAKLFLNLLGLVYLQKLALGHDTDSIG